MWKTDFLSPEPTQKQKILKDAWKSVNELKAGLKRTEEKLSKLKTSKIRILTSPVKDKNLLQESSQGFAKKRTFNEFYDVLAHDDVSQDVLSKLKKQQKKTLDTVIIQSPDGETCSVDSNYCLQTDVRILNDELAVSNIRNAKCFQTYSTKSGENVLASNVSSNHVHSRLDDVSKLHSVATEGNKFIDFQRELPSSPRFLQKDTSLDVIRADGFEKLKRVIEQQRKNERTRKYFDSFEDKFGYASKKMDDDVSASDEDRNHVQTNLPTKPIRKICNVSDPRPYQGYSQIVPLSAFNKNSISVNAKQMASRQQRILNAVKSENEKKSKMKRMTKACSNRGLITPATWKEDTKLIRRHPVSKKRKTRSPASHLQEITDVDDKNKGESSTEKPVSEKSAKKYKVKKKLEKIAAPENVIIPKVRHYNSEIIRSYIDRKRNQFNTKRKQENEDKKKELQLKKYRLQELYETQKRNAIASMKVDKVSSSQPSLITNATISLCINEDVEVKPVSSGSDKENKYVNVPKNDSLQVNDADDDVRSVTHTRDKNFHEIDISNKTHHNSSASVACKASEIRALAEHIQHRIDQETKLLLAAGKKDERKFQAEDKEQTESRQDIRTQDVDTLSHPSFNDILPGVQNLTQHLISQRESKVKNDAAIRIQKAWKSFVARKMIQHQMASRSNIVDSFLESDSVSEGPISSKDYRSMSKVNEDNYCNQSMSPVDDPPFHADPFNFISTLSRQNLEYSIRRYPYEIDVKEIVVMSSSRSSTLSYKSDFVDVSSSSKTECSEHSSVSAMRSMQKNSSDSKSDVSTEIDVQSVYDDAVSSVSMTLSEGPLSSNGTEDDSVAFSDKNKESEAINTSFVESSSKNVKSVEITSGVCDNVPISFAVTSTDKETSNENTAVCKIGKPPILEHESSAKMLHARMQIELYRLGSIESSIQEVDKLEQMKRVGEADSKSVGVVNDLLKASEDRRHLEVDHLMKMFSEQRRIAEERLEAQLKQHDAVLTMAAQNIAEVKHDTTVEIQNSTANLIKTQADATRQLVKVFTDMKKRDFSDRQTSSLEQSYLKKSDEKSVDEDISSFVTSTVSTASQLYGSKANDNSTNQESGSVIRTESASIPAQSFQERRTTSEVDEESKVNSAKSSTNNISEHIDSEQTSRVETDISSRVSPSYSMKFDDTMTEEEKCERSFRMILPSESHRRRSLTIGGRESGNVSDVSSCTSAISVYSSNHHSKLSKSMNAGRLSKTSSLSGQNCFERFTMDMVKQFMKEGELRSHHQRSLLELRERAVIEKTKAELAWLEMQKKSLRNRGADDQMPPIRKKQRGLLLRFQQERADIKRLKDVQKAAEQERMMLLKQHQDIRRLHKTTKQIRDKIKTSSIAEGTKPMSLSQLSLTSSIKTNHSAIKHKSLPTTTTTTSSNSDHVIPEDDDKQVEGDSRHDNESSTASKSGTENKSRCGGSESKHSVKELQINKRSLMSREQKLLVRKKTLEELIQWQKKLDQDEAEVRAKEKHVLQTLSKEKRLKLRKMVQTSSLEGDAKNIDKNSSTDECDKQSLETVVPTASIIDSQFSKNRSTASSITEDIRQEQPSEIADDGSGVETAADVTTAAATTFTSESQSSIVENLIPNTDKNSSATHEVSSISTKMSESNNYDLYSESFESSTPLSDSKEKRLDFGIPNVHKEKRSSPETSVSNDQSGVGRPNVTIRSPLSPRLGGGGISHRRHDSSGSEDSFTVSLSETASDQSDVEGRIHALREELRRRKCQADRLKREHKRIYKERLRAQEASLIKQLEAYDKYIVEATQDLEKELETDAHQLQKTVVKPQIKHPEESRRLRRHLEFINSSNISVDLTTSPPIIADKGTQYNFKSQTSSESESSKSVSSFDEVKNDEVNLPAAVSKESTTRSPKDDRRSVDCAEDHANVTNDKSRSVESARESAGIIAVTDKVAPEIVSTSENTSASVCEALPIVHDRTSIIAGNEAIVCENRRQVEPERHVSLSSMADKITDYLMNDVLVDSIKFASSARSTRIDGHNVYGTFENLSGIGLVKVEPARDTSEFDIDDFASVMVSRLLDESVSCIAEIYHDQNRDVIYDKNSENGSSSNVSKRVSMIMSEVQEKQNSSNRDRHRRPQDLMVLSSPTLVEDDDGSEAPLRPSENFPFTDIFQQDDDKEVLFVDQEWFDDDFGLGSDGKRSTGSKESKEDVVYPSFFYREIPNKPPPPYIPPQSGPYSIPPSGGIAVNHDVLGSQKNLLVAKSGVKKLLSIESYIAVPHSPDQITQLVLYSVQYIYAMLENVDGMWSASTLRQVKPPSNDYFTEQDLDIGLESRSRHSYKTFVFDLVRELVIKLYCDREVSKEIPEGKYSLKMMTSSRPKPSFEKLSSQIEENVLKLFGFSRQAKRLTSGTGFNAVLRLGQKKRDRVDDILVEELRGEESEWISYDADELVVKAQLTNSLFDDLIAETVSVVRKTVSKKHRR